MWWCFLLNCELLEGTDLLYTVISNAVLVLVMRLRPLRFALLTILTSNLLGLPSNVLFKFTNK